MGATLVPGGATFRVWAPRAAAVYLNGVFGGAALDAQSDDLLMAEDAGGYWTGFVPGAAEGDLYHYFVEGPASQGYKRDPYARELADEAAFPNSLCIVRSPSLYPWHDMAFVTPDYSDMIVYQVHIGTYAIGTPGVASNFLDVIGKIPYLVALGINVLQPLPVDEVESDPSMGYDGADYFSPDFPYVAGADKLPGYLATINGLLAAKGLAPLELEHVVAGSNQLKALVDLCHVYGIGVAFDVVYNHAGGFTVNNALDDECLFFFDRLAMGNNNDSLYFTDQDRGTGGLAFALWNNDVRQFLLDNAKYYIEELHADGFRNDEISILLSTNKDSGWSFCRDLTDTLRFLKPRCLQNAEYWPFEFNDYPKSAPSIVTATGAGGAGFDTLQHDGLRSAIRNAIQSAAGGQQAAVDFQSIAGALYPQGFAHGWQTVPCIENHDLVKAGREPRIPTLADSSNPRSWYARSRTRFAMGLLLTAPGIPQLFMGQEFLEEKPWDIPPDSPDLLGWAGLEGGADPAMGNHLLFTQDLIRLRLGQPALRGDDVNAFHASDANRVIAYHRWLEGSGQDVVVVATLSESNWYGYAVGFPSAGYWMEVFNSDVYDNFVNPIVAGNGGGVEASGPPLHGFAASAAITIPANGMVVFGRG